ncbi:MAG TPA: ATP synthase F0 subunit B [Candidatus Koribacter sp.]|jgi:F-type H+-transporting ATPase subunit b
MTKALRNFSIILVAMFMLALMPVCAQEAQQQKPENAAQSTEQQQRPENPNAAVGEELAKESKAAEGQAEKEDQTTGLKHSTMVQKLAKLLGVSVETAYWIAMFINFAILFLAIGGALKSKLPAMFKQRNESIQRGIAEARAASEDAKRRLADIETRLSRLDSEVNDIKGSSEKESAAEEARIRAQAETDVKRVLESAEKEIEAAGKQARRDLKALAAGLAVDLAERKLQIDQETDEALVRNFVTQLGKDGR